jgi:hypothetical protein
MKHTPVRILALSILIALTGTAALGQDEIDLASLTVPQGRLVEGCELSPSPTVALGGNRVRGGLWGDLPRNPWMGAEPSVIADMRERVATSPPLPDGPPLSRAELAQFRAQLAEDVEGGYGAVYTEAGTHLITVNAVRFKDAPVPNRPGRRSISDGSVRLARGRTVVVAFGQGSCFAAIGAYLPEVMGR